MLDFGKKVVTKVVRDNEVNFCGLSYMLSDDEIYSLKDFIENNLGLNGDTKEVVEDVEEVVEPKKSTKGSSKKTTKTEEDEVKPRYTPTENYAIAMQRKNNILSTDLVCVSKENGECRARFNYNYILTAISKGKKSTYDYMKESVFKPEIKAYGVEWVDNTKNDDIDFGWYVFKSEKKAKEYAEMRVAKDKEYSKKKAGKSNAPVVSTEGIEKMNKTELINALKMLIA